MAGRSRPGTGVSSIHFRLDTGVRPERYDAALRLDWGKKRFSGQQTIEIRMGGARSELVLHAAGLDITSAVLTSGRRRLEPKAIKPYPASETVVLRFSDPLPKGRSTLSLEWSGAFNPGLRGLYASGAVAMTQFQAADARRVFPCFDEPAFKARWKLRLWVARGAVALANGRQVGETEEGEGRWVEFEETPPISSYLVALAAGELQSSPEIRVGKVPLRTWSVPDKAHLTAYAQDVAQAVLPQLEAYFGVPYAFGKVDQVGVPDFEAGAMENVGLITFRESALLLDPATAALATQKRVAEVITHELAHQWYGNLVTMDWWTDLWLNEAFATWMAAKIVDAWRPEWRVWLDFDASRAEAMALDALRSTHPVRGEVRNAHEAGESFDAITYEKGGAVLRMIEGYLGEETFHRGIRAYMKKHAWGSTTDQHLWRALEEASRIKGKAAAVPVRKLADAWISQSGFPVVSVERRGEVVTLSQRRFFSAPRMRSNQTWPVPVILKYADGRGVREQRYLLKGASRRVRLEARGEVAWVLANAGSTGFYRVDYAPEALADVAGHWNVLEPSERVQLIADLWAQVRSGRTPVGALLDLAQRAQGEEDYAVLDEWVARLGTLEHDFTAEPDRPAFRAFVEQLLSPGLEELGWAATKDASHAQRLRRSALVRGVGGVARSAPTVEEARRRLERFMRGDRSALAPDLHGPAVAMAARQGDAALFDALVARGAEERDPAYKRAYLLAPALFEATALNQRAESMAFTSAIPVQDFAFFVSALLANPSSRERFWKRVRTDWGTLKERVGGPALLRRVIYGIGQLPERKHFKEATAFLKKQKLEEARQMVAQTLERMEHAVELRERLGPQIRAWLKQNGERSR
ncbi:MAG TPA: M1 family metallopeptidase [Myxococcaceae bacterium]|nr:M1 family metallopeptidase [Myxococcaceae bacterium]